ncbi:MAG: radical SAM protein [Oscillospiraceae bacterium]|nr:radical SAM protein [Oscillospiraceae bacterium]
MIHKQLNLVVDMYGCPNRCLHCWLGHMPNRTMEEGADTWLVEYFKPWFSTIAYYSWLREPDFCGGFRERWTRDNALSVNAKPERFELASFWRLVRDPEYVGFLKDVGTRRVQLTLFGLEEMTDKYVGRKGAFQEILKATEILLENQISPRWQAFINEENKDEIAALPGLAGSLDLEKRCKAFGETFKFFVHEGSCDGENRKLYPIRIEKAHIPQALIPYYLQYGELLTEAECCMKLEGSLSHEVPHNEEQITLNISNTFDVFFNFTHMTEAWKIGNLKTDSQAELIRRIVEEDTPALNLARRVTLGELAERYGDPASRKAFSLGDYQGYLLNRCLEERLG